MAGEEKVEMTANGARIGEFVKRLVSEVDRPVMDMNGNGAAVMTLFWIS